MPIMPRLVDTDPSTAFIPARPTPAGDPEPANDNASRLAFARYVRELRAYAQADYVPARAKEWWLP